MWPEIHDDVVTFPSFQGIMHGIPIMSIYISVVACIRLFVGFTMRHPTVGGGISILCWATVTFLCFDAQFAAMYILVDFGRSLVSPLHMFPMFSLFRSHFSLQLVTFLCLLVDCPLGSQHLDLVGGLNFEV